MKVWIRWFTLLIGLFLVACGGRMGGETAVAPTTAIAEQSQVENRPVDPNRLYALSDLSQVANTGRPQFLNSFANW